MTKERTGREKQLLLWRWWLIKGSLLSGLVPLFLFVSYMFLIEGVAYGFTTYGLGVEVSREESPLGAWFVFIIMESFLIYFLLLLSEIVPSKLMDYVRRFYLKEED